MELTRLISNFSMSLNSNGHSNIYVIVKLCLIFNVIKREDNPPIRINLPLILIRRIILILAAEVHILCDDSLWL